jgi:hypothetical protein
MRAMPSPLNEELKPTATSSSLVEQIHNLRRG